MSKFSQPAFPNGAYFGLTKREYFAGVALQALLSATDGRGAWMGLCDNVTKTAVQVADRMLEELGK